VASASVDQASAPVLRNPKARKEICNGVDIARRPLTVPVIVVQDEDSLVAAQLIDGHAVTIANGHHEKYDWTPLHGRDVFIWPTPSDDGYAAAALLGSRLHGKAKNVGVVRGLTETLAAASGDRIPGAVVDLMHENIRPIEKSAPVKKTKLITPNPAPKSPTQVFQPYLDTDQGESVLVSWESLGLDRVNGSAPFASLDNATRIIQLHPHIRNSIWYDVFTQKVRNSFHGEPRDWVDDDDSDLAVFIQRQLKLPKFTISLIAEAARHAARRRERNDVTTWLDSLKWDKTERLGDWMADFLGVARTDYTMAVSRNWLIAMVARAFEPGCQMDSMLVLEGESGLGKSTFIKELAKPWYAEIDEPLHSKDFLQQIQGVWVLEFPDMNGFSATKHDQAIGKITMRTDVYRASYGRNITKSKRVTLFVGSSEHDQYLTDEGGARKFWPIHCTAIDLEAFKSQRENLFAEAVFRYRNGEPWHIVPNSAKDEQLRRIKRDVWTDKIMKAVEDKEREHTLFHSNEVFRFSASDVLDWLGVETSRQNDGEKGRVTRALIKNGFTQSTAHSRRFRRAGLSNAVR
jgi:predicted P-loop ATPase